jgi:hypothetical protein
MNDLRHIQRCFQKSLCHEDDSITEFIIKPSVQTVSHRLKIYDDDYFMRLHESMQDDFEMLHQYLGDRVFQSLVKDYLHEYPSHSYTLRELGFRFPQFLADHQKGPEVIELSRFECEILKSRFSADAEVLSLAHIKNISAEQWENIKFHFHPSLRTLSLDYNTLDLWLSLDKKTPIISSPLELPAIHLIWRYDYKIYFRRATEMEAALLKAIGDGNAFSLACKIMLDYGSENQVIEWVIATISAWIDNGVFSSHRIDF